GSGFRGDSLWASELVRQVPDEPVERKSGGLLPCILVFDDLMDAFDHRHFAVHSMRKGRQKGMREAKRNRIIAADHIESGNLDSPQPGSRQIRSAAGSDHGPYHAE